LGNADAFAFGRGCEPRIDYHLTDSVPRLGNDKLPVNGRPVTVGNGKGSGAVRVHRVGARASSPARRNVAVYSNRVKLRYISVAVEGGLGEAINEQGDPFGRKTVPWIVKAYVPLMVKLLQALAWAVKVDDAAKVRVSRKSEMRDFIVPPDFLLASSSLECSTGVWSPRLAGTIAWLAGTRNGQRVNRVVNWW